MQRAPPSGDGVACAREGLLPAAAAAGLASRRPLHLRRVRRVRSRAMQSEADASLRAGRRQGAPGSAGERCAGAQERARCVAGASCCVAPAASTSSDLRLRGALFRWGASGSAGPGEPASPAPAPGEACAMCREADACVRCSGRQAQGTCGGDLLSRSTAAALLLELFATQWEELREALTVQMDVPRSKAAPQRVE